MKNAVFLAALCAALVSCSGQEPTDPPKPPKNPPMKLDPHPPISSADIDAIVNETNGRKPATGGNAK